jgi:hypothetical protein
VSGLAIDLGGFLGGWRLPIEPILPSGGSANGVGVGKIGADVRGCGAAGARVVEIGGFLAIGRSVVGVDVGVGKGSIDLGAIGRSVVAVRVGVGFGWLGGKVGRSKVARSDLAGMGESIAVGVGLSLGLGAGDRGKANVLVGGGVVGVAARNENRSGGLGVGLAASLVGSDRGWSWVGLAGTGGFALEGSLNFSGLELDVDLGLDVDLTAVVIGGVAIGGIMGVT